MSADLGTARSLLGDGHDGRLLHLRAFVDGNAVLRWHRVGNKGWGYIVVTAYEFHLGSYWWEAPPAAFPEWWSTESRRTERAP